MKIYGLCVVKDEDDIIQQSINHALKFCDCIIILDNGSTDETWNILQDLARQHTNQIILFGQSTEPFRDSIRSLIYNEFHKQLSEEDWWLRLDSDEFLVQDPRHFIQATHREKADFIQAWQIQFYYTDQDHKNWLAGQDLRDNSIIERRRYYKINWREYRFFRNQSHQSWDINQSSQWPNGLQTVAHKKIYNRHYQYRDPEQIQKRLKGRYKNPEFNHVNSLDWQAHICPAHKLNYFQSNQPWQFNSLDFYRLKIMMKLTGKSPKY
ncbi:MAG: glycosyltransferase family 2 protein [Thermosynechococcaceae cyanobacterium]